MYRPFDTLKRCIGIHSFRRAIGPRSNFIWCARDLDLRTVTFQVIPMKMQPTSLSVCIVRVAVLQHIFTLSGLRAVANVMRPLPTSGHTARRPGKLGTARRLRGLP